MRTRRLLGLVSLTSAATMVAFAAPVAAAQPHDDPSPRTVDSRFSDEAIRLMAKTSGRTVEAQKRYLDAQRNQNNAYAGLHAQGRTYGGAYFDSSNRLVVQAEKGSADAQAAEKAGLRVSDPENGQPKLEKITGELTSATASGSGAKAGVVSIVPDVARDRVVVTVAGDTKAARSLAARYGDAVEVRSGAANTTQAVVLGGDKMSLGGGYCSAGFPAKSRSGTRYMVWAGHCIEDVSTVGNASGTRIGRVADSQFKSYDGKDDRDIGAVQLDAEDSVSRDVNDWGSGRALDANKGVWRAPVGTDTCKSGATTGITCGKITGYGATVTYSDAQGRTQARVTDLGSASICTAAGDSGGAYVAGGYAVGMTSGGPANQRCTFNGGYAGGSSYFQPVDDALAMYGMTYGN